MRPRPAAEKLSGARRDSGGEVEYGYRDEIPEGSEVRAKQMSEAEYGDIYVRLDALGQHDTVSSFARAFYELIAEYTLGEGLQAQWLRNRFAEYLDAETRYHRALAGLASEDAAVWGDLRSATEKREIALRALLEQLGRPVLSGAADVGRLLVSAECYYQLGMIEHVVERLECAIEAGAKHGLVYFALGYNRYLLAVQAFTAYSASSGTRQVMDEARFRAACLRAVSAFQEGLSGDEFDGQLHWWIGTVLEATGFSEAAAASHKRANEIMEAARGLNTESAQEDELGLDFGGDYEYERQVERKPITEEEVRKAALLLRQSYRASDLLE